MYLSTSLINPLTIAIQSTCSSRAQTSIHVDYELSVDEKEKSQTMPKKNKGYTNYKEIIIKNSHQKQGRQTTMFLRSLMTEREKKILPNWNFYSYVYFT